MASERPRLVVDTNVWISFLIGKTLTGLGELLVDNRVVLLQCEELFSEMLEVLERPKFRQYFSPDDIRELVEVGEPRPIGERGGWNVYGFVADSPAGNVDPYGKLRYGGPYAAVHGFPYTEFVSKCPIGIFCTRAGSGGPTL